MAMHRVIQEASDVCCPPVAGRDLSPEDAAALAATLKALADPVRLRIVNLLANCDESCVCDLPALLGVSQPTVSHHLRQLLGAGIVERDQRGRWAWYRLRPGTIAELRQALAVPGAA